MGLVAAHFGMVALALGYAFALAFELTPEKILPQAFVAATALAAAVTAALDLERAVDIVQRERPAVVAGLLWLAAYVLAVVICGAQETLLFRSSVSSTDAMQWWKWITVLCFAISAAAAVAGVWVSTKCAPLLESSQSTTACHQAFAGEIRHAGMHVSPLVDLLASGVHLFCAVHNPMCNDPGSQRAGMGPSSRGMAHALRYNQLKCVQALAHMSSTRHIPGLALYVSMSPNGQ